MTYPFTHGPDMNYARIALVVNTFRDYITNEDISATTAEDLRWTYHDLLTEEECKEAHDILQGVPGNLIDEHPTLAVEAIGEALHSSLDGVQESSKMVIESFLNDVDLYIKSSLELTAKSGDTT